MTVHAKLGASSADRWMNCPGSLRLGQDIPNTTSVYAQEGTAAHALAEMCLTRGVPPEKFIGMELEGVEVTDEMADAVQVYLDEIERQAEPGDVVYTEHRFDLKDLNPPGPMFGTADHVRWNTTTEHLRVFDLKYGQGYAVAAKENPQLRYYGLGAALSLNVVPKKITLTIVQPRANHPDGIVRHDDVSLGDLLAFTVDLLDAAHISVRDDAPLAIGHWCRFCPAIAVCPRQKEHAVALARTEFERLPVDMPPPPEMLTDDELHTVLEKADIVEDWLKSVRQYVQGKLERGETFPGYKLVAKRANRKWADEEALQDFLRAVGFEREDAFEQKLRSVASVERMLKKGGVNVIPPDLVVKKSSGYTLAPDADPRPAESSGPANEFTALPIASNSQPEMGTNGD